MKKIKGFSYYSITKDGKVLSTWFKKPKFKKLQNDKDGYKIIVLNKKGCSFNKKVHRLVAEAFIQNPEGKPCVNHLNGDKSDNRVDNLEWTTYKENQNHAIKKGLLNLKGEKCFFSKLNNVNVKEILTKKFDGLNQSEIADIYGVERKTINRILNKKTWTHI